MSVWSSLMKVKRMVRVCSSIASWACPGGNLLIILPRFGYFTSDNLHVKWIYGSRIHVVVLGHLQKSPALTGSTIQCCYMWVE